MLISSQASQADIFLFFLTIYIDQTFHIYIHTFSTIPSLASEKKIEGRKAFVQMAAKAHYDADPDETAKQVEGVYSLFPRGLNIVWGKDPRYWRIPGKEDPAPAPAELIQVCWLEVTGSLQLEANKTYEVGFKVSLTPDAFGWNGCPVYVMAKFGKKGKYTWRRATLTTDKAEVHQIPEQALRITSETEKTLYFGLYEVWSGKWKGGLKIHEAFIKKINP